MPTKLGTGKPVVGRQLSIWLPKKLDDQVQRIAQAEALSASAVVRRAVVRDVRRNDERQGAS
jgi:predicted transcriptional regulator